MRIRRRVAIARHASSGSVAALAAFAALAACSSGAPTPGGGGGQGGQGAAGSGSLSPNATYVNAKSAVDVEVAADHLSFPAATHPDMLHHVAGDVLVGAKGGAKNPWGFLRKVAGFPVQEGSSIVVPTAPATLQEAVTQAQFQATLASPKLTAAGPVQAASGAVHPLGGVGASGGTTIQLLDFSGTKLLDVSNSATLPSGDTVGYRAHATVTTGTLDFSPSFDIGADIEPNFSDPLASLRELHVTATGALAADLELNLGMNITGNMTGTDLAQLIAQGVMQSPSATLADYPIDLGSIPLGFIDIPVHAQFTATLACDLSYGGGLGVDVGAKTSGTVTAGFEYKNGTMTPVFAHTESFTMIGPVYTMDSAVHVRCRVRPLFDLSFFDVAAGSVYADPHVSLDAAAECSASALTGTVSGSAQAGIDAVASASVNAFGLFSWAKTCTLFDVESPTSLASGTFPLPGGANTSCVSHPPPAIPALPAPPPSCFGGSSAGSGSGSPGGTDPADAAAAGDGGTCTHSACARGPALSPSCTLDSQAGACIAAICQNDTFCCSLTWDGSCVAHLTNGDYGCLKTDCP